MTEQKFSLANPGELNILAFGNSLTEGYTNFGLTFHPYGIALEKKLSKLFPNLKINVDINGRSGDCVLPELVGIYIPRLQESLAREDHQPSHPKYDLVIMLGGTNDLAHLLEDPDCSQKIFDGLKTCYNHVLESGASLLCMTVPPRAIDSRNNRMGQTAKAKREHLNDLIKRFVERTQNSRTASQKGKAFLMDLAALVPFSSLDQREDENWEDPIWSVDGLHMRAEGYDFVGEELGSFIYDILEHTPTES